MALVVQHDDEGVDAVHMKHRVGAERAGDLDARAAASAIAGVMISISSRPNSPPSPACGLRPLTAIARRGDAEPLQRALAPR